jgi:hypothetical protein
MASLLEVKKAIEEILLKRDDVIGIGTDDASQRLRVYVLEDEYDIIPDIPPMMSGFPVDVVPIPGFETIAEPDYRTKRFRPVIGGVSAAHMGVTAGTLGAVIRDKKTGLKFFLSNNHTFANTATADNYRAAIGDLVIQPSVSDGGTAADVIATLYKYVPFVNDKTNLVDAALALPIDQQIASPYILADDKLNTIAISGIRAVDSLIEVKKYGRTSGADRGEVLDYNFTVAVDFDDGLTRNFVDQILISIETRGGDSGSILLDDSNRAVGLVFAGGIDKKGRFFGVANKIHNVLAMLSDEEIDLTDGWKSSDSMTEPPPHYELR